MTRITLVPGTLALLPRFASWTDPIPELRAACESAVGWLGHEVTILADDDGWEIADHLLETVGRYCEEPSYLVVGNGTARRTDASPGPFHADAAAFDEDLGTALAAGSLTGVELSRAEELWARLGGIPQLAGLLDGTPGEVDLAQAPFGVQYWVIRWHVAGSAIGWRP